jgi:hypothetical protein
MKVTNYEENPEEVWPTLFISFYAMSKFFIGQKHKSKKFYRKNHNYTELVDAMYTLETVLSSKVSRRKLGFLGKFKAIFYLSLIKKMLGLIGVDIEIHQYGYPFVFGNTYEVGYYVNQSANGREYLTYEIFEYLTPEGDPYLSINANNIVSVKKIV